MKPTVFFADPEWLWAGAALALAALALLWWSSRARARQLAAFADAAQREALLASHSPALRAVKNTVLVICILLLGVAMARPQWGVIEEEAQRARGEDVVFVLDLSKSMLAKDVTPNRLERAKLAMLAHLHTQKGGRVGLVVFAGNAFLRVPLTLDYAAFEESVMASSPEDLFVPGTDIGTALAVGKNAFERNEQRKLLVLLTDGEDLGKLGVKAAEEFSKDGIVVFTIGLGTAGGAAVQVPQPNGMLAPLLGEDGQPVISRLDEKTLKQIAEATGGTYRRLDRINDATVDLQRSLRTAAGTAPSLMKRRGVDRYAWFLAVAILLLVMESLLTTRRRIKT